MSGAPPLVELEDVFKRFGSTQALNGVTLKISGGELVGLIGPNGAGKSTAMRTIAGEHRPDRGAVRIRGTEVTHAYSALRALRFGVRTVYQELDLPGNLAVGEAPIYAAPKAVGRRFGWRSRAERLIMARLEEIFPRSGIAPSTQIERLSIAQRQMTAIALATLWSDDEPPTCLILDEPTSSLDVLNARKLYDWLRGEAQAKQIAVLVSTHKLNEVIGELDRAYVMVNGAVAAHRAMENTTRADLVSAMHTGLEGKSEIIDSSMIVAEDRSAKGAIAIERYADTTLAINDLTVGSGEVIGLGGLEGQGQKQFLRAIFSLAGGTRDEGVVVDGRVAFVSGDRGTDGVFPIWDVERNISMSSLDALTRLGLVSGSRERALAAQWRDALRLKGALDDPITSLSGGTQQKALVARALAQAPDVLLLDDPTRGVDEDTKIEIFTIIRAQARRGAAVLWYSTETAELHRCDRVYVMQGGRIVDHIVTEGSDSKSFEDRVLGASFAA